MPPSTYVSLSLIAFLLANASHSPDEFPTPPYPPHAHIEQGTPSVSSVVANVAAMDAAVYAIC